VRPDTKSALSLGSFRTPVPVPTLDPDADPLISISVNCQWLPHIRGALLQLMLQYTWPQADKVAADLAQARANTLLSMFTECDSTPPAFACPYDFRDTDGGWVGLPISVIGYSPSPLAVWVSSAGWSIVDSCLSTTCLRGVYIMLAVDPSATLTSVSFKYDLIKGVALTGGWISGVQFFDASFGLIGGQYVPYQDLPDATDATFTATGSWTGATWAVCAITCDSNDSGPLAGDATIHAAQVYGAGPTPC